MDHSHHGIAVVLPNTDHALSIQRKTSREALRLAWTYRQKGQGGDSAYISFSHKRQYAAAVWAYYPVGIDVEKIDMTRSLRLWKIVASEAEWERMEPDWCSFYRIWTAKEAVIKAAGICDNLWNALRTCSIVHSKSDHGFWTLQYQDAQWHVRHTDFDHHMCAVACPLHHALPVVKVIV